MEEKLRPVAFISYSRNDLDFAQKLVTDFGKCDIDLWLDIDEIPEHISRVSLGGNTPILTEELGYGIYRTDAVVLLLSPDCVKSSWVEMELKIAANNSASIIPLLLKPCRVPICDSTANPPSNKKIALPLKPDNIFTWPYKDLSGGWGMVANYIMTYSPTLYPDEMIRNLSDEDSPPYINFTDSEKYVESFTDLLKILIYHKTRKYGKKSSN